MLLDNLDNSSFPNSPHPATGSQSLPVEAGLQTVMQIFITNASNVFLLEQNPAPNSSTQIGNQVDMCKRVLNIYRHMVMNQHLEQKTWLAISSRFP